MDTNSVSLVKEGRSNKILYRHVSSERPVRNRIFYFDDDPMAIFLVENQLFKIHRHFLIKNSEVFRDMFVHAEGKEGFVNGGASEDKPILLPDVTIQEFELLLRFFYETTVQPTAKGRRILIMILDCALEEKLALLSIAHRFKFSKLFQYTIDEIYPDKVSVLERIRLGDKYGLNGWLSTAYKAIIDRSPKGEATKEEAEALGLERVNKLLQAKIFMLHEQLRNAERHKIYAYEISQCSEYFDQPPPTDDKKETTSTETVVKKFYPSVQQNPDSDNDDLW